MAPRLQASNPNVKHAVVLAGILLFSLGVLLGAALPVPRALPRRPVGMNGYGANLDALLVSQASDGFAVLPGMDNKFSGMDDQSTVGGDGMTADGAACKCSGKACEDPAAKSAAELMLAEPKMSLDDAMKRIDALSRSRTHLGKEKLNLEGERNALNKVVKEAKVEISQCSHELKELKGRLKKGGA